MHEPKSFANLRDTLAALFDGVDTIKRISDDAGLNSDAIDFSGSALKVWHSVLAQAEKEFKTKSLMSKTVKEFYNNENLTNAWHDFLDSKPRIPPVPGITPSSRPSYTAVYIIVSLILVTTVYFAINSDALHSWVRGTPVTPPMPTLLSIYTSTPTSTEGILLASTLISTSTLTPLSPALTFTPTPTSTETEISPTTTLTPISTSTSTSTSTLTPTSTPTDTPQPTATYTSVPPTATAIPPTPIPIVSLPDLIVPATASNGVLFTARMDGMYKFAIKDGVYCAGKDFCRSILHAYVDREIVWGDWYNLPHPIDPDYEIGCWENETEQNRECGTGKSAILHLKDGQTIRWIIMEDQNSFNDNTGVITLAIEVTQ